MENPEDVKGFMNGTWYNNDADLIELGFTEEELTTFYDTSDTAQFGY